MTISSRTVRASDSDDARMASARQRGWHAASDRGIFRCVPLHPALFFYTCALVLGIAAGMRSMMAPAVLAITLSRRPEYAPALSPVHWFTLVPVAVVLGIAALGELVADKLPATPNRTALGPFVARFASGAITGAAVVQIGQFNAWFGAACGALGAILSTFGAFHARRFVARTTSIGDPLLGGAEDIVAIALAASVMATLVG
jgi:uncharacterized membrane protein